MLSGGIILLHETRVVGQGAVFGRLFVSESSVTPPTSTSQSVTLTGVETTVDQLRNQGISVYLPSYLPKHLKLNSVMRLKGNSPIYDYIDLEMHFEGWSSQSQAGPDFMIIRQRELKGPTKIHISSSKIIKTLQIEGNQAVYYNPSDDPDRPAPNEWKTLMLVVDKHEIALNGNVGFEELVKVAQSLKPYQ